MELVPLTLRLPPDLLNVSEGIAASDDVTIGQFARHALTQEVSRRRNARPPVRADERLIAPLRARLAPTLAAATNWHDLGNRLAEQGFALQQAGGGLAVHRHPNGARVCKASELGFSYSRLMRRFRAPFPGHTHTWLFERIKEEPRRDEALVLIEED
ncbi:MAG: hypothetical protein AAGA87_09385 [Pseudomonadota bacterium]